MRVIDSELQERLDEGATTLAWCWRVTRADATVLGFTDHDADLVADGTTFQAAAARAAGTVETSFAFATDTSAIAGLLDAAAITEADLANGLYDGALVDLLRVDWERPDLFVHVWSGRIASVKRGETGFEAELRGVGAALDRTVGRVLQRRCDAELGDARCTVDLDNATYTASAAVADVLDARRITTSDLGAYAVGWFANGRLTWTSGANTGAAYFVEAHRAYGADMVLELLTAPSAPMQAGDGFSVVAGCDKRFPTCQSKFANTDNHRGFPHMPGDDWIQSVPRQADANDGGRRDPGGVP